MAAKIAEVRDRDQKQKANTFLDSMSPEQALLLSMMADAGDEVCQLLRACDQGLDTADLLLHVNDFVNRTYHIVHQRAVFMTSGFTEFTLKHTLKKPHVLDCRRRGEVHVRGRGRAGTHQRQVHHAHASMATPCL